MTTRVIEQTLSVPFAYPVVFTDHVFTPENRALLDALCRPGETLRRRAAVFFWMKMSRALFPG